MLALPGDQVWGREWRFAEDEDAVLLSKNSAAKSSAIPTRY